MKPKQNHHISKVAIGLLSLGFGFLSWLSQSTLKDELWLFLSAIFAANGLLFSFYCYLKKYEISLSSGFVWWGACLFHLIGVLGNPLFEDDYFRYLWDAYHTVHYGSPYGIPPSHYFSSMDIPDLFQAILGQINYPDVPTVYGPIQQYSFLLAYWISPGEVWPLQLIYSIADMMLIGLLLRLATPNNVMLYAWSPLVFKEVMLTAHPDVVGVLFLMAAVYCYSRQYLMACVVFLSASIAAKVFAILLLPFLMVGMRFKHWFVFAISLVAIYTPLYMNGESDLSGLMAMTKNWEFNSMAFGALRIWFDPVVAKLLLGFLLVGFVGGYWLVYVARYQFARTKSVTAMPIVRGDWIIGLFLLCAPVINPWYLVWVLPFAVIYPSYSIWTASIVVMLAYVTGLNLDSDNLGPYEQPLVTRLIQVGAIAIALWSDFKKRRER